MNEKGETNTVYLGLGSNLGDRAGNIDRALRMLAELPGITLQARSALIETAPIGGPPGQGDYLNGAAVVLCDRGPRGPREMLTALKTIERAVGRTGGERWGPREIDLDILLFGDRVVEEDGLRIPHPRMAQRRFVLEVLCEIAPDAVHPTLGQTVRQMLAAVGSVA